MFYFPLFLNISEVKFLIIGAGNIALAKIEALLEFTNNITVIAPEINIKEIIELANDNNIELIKDVYNKKYLFNYDIIIAATNEKNTNEKIANDARGLGKLVNAVDNPENSDFIFGANIKHQNITISSSTSGISPVLSRLLKQRLNKALPTNLSLLSNFVTENKNLVRKKLVNLQARRLFWQEALEGNVGIQIEAGNIKKAQKLLENKLELKNNNKQAAVYFIGAGPGDPDLITLKAINILSRADIVLYDRLVSKDILKYARRDALKINVGKSCKIHRYTQEEINQLIVQYAAKGNIVVRLKGGDTAIFAHLSEEIDEVLKAKIDYQIIPGISAASGAASYSGIPLTSRQNNKAVRFVSAHGKELFDNNYWQNMAQSDDTLVFYMSSHNLPTIITNLIKFGKSIKTGLAIIEQATTPYQKTHITDMANFNLHFAEKQFISPSLIIIGDVVKQHKDYKWKEEILNGIYFEAVKPILKHNES